MNNKVKDSKLVLKSKKPNYDGLKVYHFTDELKNYISSVDLNRFVQYYYEEIVNTYNYLQNNDMSFNDYCIFCYKHSSEGNTKNYPKRLANAHLYQGYYYIDDDVDDNIEEYIDGDEGGEL
jgi:hypothetical protein